MIDCACEITPSTLTSSFDPWPVAVASVECRPPSLKRCVPSTQQDSTSFLVETVGVGQSEIEIGDLVDTTVLVLAPGLGDGIQMIKSGIMDIADIYVINKADRDGADDVVRDLLGKERLMRRPAGVWRPPVVRTVATRREGSEEVLSAIEKHRNWIDEKGDLVRRRCARAKSEIYAIALDEVRRQLDTKRARAALNSYAAEVASGRSDPYSAAAALIAGM